MDNTINFNSNNWDSIQDTIDKVNEIGCIQFGTTEDGEDIFFDVGPDNTLITDVVQDNGWVRRNIYHPNDCTVEEIYKKDGDFEA